MASHLGESLKGTQQVSDIRLRQDLERNMERNNMADLLLSLIFVTLQKRTGPNSVIEDHSLVIPLMSLIVTMYLSSI